jgi:hypothetical protein
VACALGASTLTPAPARADEPQRAILRLSVNQVDKGEVMVLVKDSDVLVGAADLEQAGLRVGGAVAARRETAAPWYRWPRWRPGSPSRWIARH